MGSALASAVKKTGAELIVSDYDRARAEDFAKKECCQSGTNMQIADQADIIFLAVKPNIICSVAEEIKSALNGRRCTVVTMAAGVKIKKLAEILGEDQPIIRIMPNTPAAVGRGMITWCKNDAVSKEACHDFEESLAMAGRLDMIPEVMIDAASAIAGCGPAFVYMFADALADGGVACGLPRDKALAYAVETLAGAAEMMKITGKHPEKLKDEVCSPGGSTIEGVLALEDGAFRATAAGAVIAAYEKTKKLG